MFHWLKLSAWHPHQFAFCWNILAGPAWCCFCLGNITCLRLQHEEAHVKDLQSSLVRAWISSWIGWCFPLFAVQYPVPISFIQRWLRWWFISNFKWTVVVSTINLTLGRGLDSSRVENDQYMTNAEASLQLEHEGLLSQFQLERAESQACALNREMVGWWMILQPKKNRRVRVKKAYEIYCVI